MKNNTRSFQKFQKMPLIFSILMVALSCFAFLFLYKEIINNKKISEEAQAQWHIEENRRAEIKSLDLFIKDVASEKVLLESHFAHSSDIVPFLDTIEDLGRSSGVKSEVVSVDILKDKSGLMIDIRSSGTFEEVYKFLILLENSPYQLEFFSTNMQNSAEQTIIDKTVIDSVWNANFKIKLLSFIE